MALSGRFGMRMGSTSCRPASENSLAGGSASPPGRSLVEAKGPRCCREARSPSRGVVSRCSCLKSSRIKPGQVSREWARAKRAGQEGRRDPSAAAPPRPGFLPFALGRLRSTGTHGRRPPADLWPPRRTDRSACAAGRSPAPRYPPSGSRVGPAPGWDRARGTPPAPAATARPGRGRRPDRLISQGLSLVVTRDPQATSETGFDGGIASGYLKGSRFPRATAARPWDTTPA